MADPLLEFDAAGSNIDATDPGSPLSIWNTASYLTDSFEAPAPPLEVQWAGSVDTEGMLPASRKHQNRTIRATVDCLSAAALRTLQGKIGKVAREGGTLKLTLPNSEVVIFDLHAADTFEPQLDVSYFTNTGGYCRVQLTLLGRPYGRGPSESLTLSSSTATSKAPLVFTVTGVKGDVPGLGFLQVANVTTSKTLLWWGLRSRYYDASSPLFYEAESLTAVIAAANAGYSGASGAGGNKVMRHPNLGAAAGIGFQLQAAHIGTYRVLARVQADSANTGTVSVRVRWYATRSAGIPTSNDWVAIEGSTGTPIEGSWVIADLGLVSLPKARFGSQQWQANFEAKSTVNLDALDWDWVAFVPVDEGSGRFTSADQPIVSSNRVVVAHDTVLGQSSTYFSAPYAGDYLLIPPAGAEARTTQMLALMTGPTSSAGNLTDTVADADNIDAVTATLSYTPRYLVVPSP